MTVKDSKFYSDDIISPGYIESTASSTRKSKEDIRFKSLIPSEILEGADGIKQLLEAYYTFLNLDEFIYEENETFSDIVLDNKAVFRISDPNNENNRFFTDEQGNSSTLTVTDASGNITTVPLSSPNVITISNGNELPGTLASLTSEVGKTFQVQFFNANGTANSSFNTQTAKIVTPVKNWVGPGPSHILNNIEQAMDIDSNSTLYLELMQKEIAAALPRSITVNKRNLYKTIVDYYKVRGSADSIEIFFRLLFNDQVEVQYPYDKTLVPSSGNWDLNAALPKGGLYLDNRGFLSNNINDLALGLDLEDVFHEYVTVLDKKGIIPCFNTVNLPFFVRKMKDYGIRPLPVMAAANKLGFFVNPSLDEFERTIYKEDVRLVVMSSLASGQLNPIEAYGYIGKLPNIEAITFGASSKEHIRQNINAINKSVGWGTCA